MGGLGITIPSKQADLEHRSSLRVTGSLRDQIILQDECYRYEVIAQQVEARALVKNENREKNSQAVRDLTELLPASLQRAVSLASEKGSSTWLTVLPLSEHGFALYKRAFMMLLHYDTVGSQIHYQLSVPVAPLSPSNMLSLVQREAFHLSGTMR